MKESLNLFVCKDVGTESLLFAALDLDCRGSTHRAWQFVAAVTLVIFIAVLPGIVYWRMHRVRDAIMNKDKAAIRQWGFLTIGLESKYFYVSCTSLLEYV